MKLSLDLKRAMVEAYRSGQVGSYEEAGEMFGMSRPTVNWLLRRQRETGDVQPRARGGNRPRVMELGWLREHAQQHPDGRLVDRMEAFGWRRVERRCAWRR